MAPHLVRAQSAYKEITQQATTQHLLRYLWWTLCNLCVLAYQVTVTADDSGLCCLCDE